MNLLCLQGVERPILWFYTPMALQYADAITPAATVYDCMDELSAFKDAPAELHRLEAELLQQADVVFTGGISLYEAKWARHPNLHAFPSAVDAGHFGKARSRLPDPADQAPIGRPRLGFVVLSMSGSIANWSLRSLACPTCGKDFVLLTLKGAHSV